MYLFSSIHKHDGHKMSLKRSGAHAERSTTAKRRKSISTPDKSQHTDSAVRAPESKPNATRIRFDSEEPLQPEAATIESLQDEESEAPLEEDDESEDEAPEAVTASEAQALAKTAAAEVSRAFERYILNTWPPVRPRAKNVQGSPRGQTIEETDR